MNPFALVIQVSTLSLINELRAFHAITTPYKTHDKMSYLKEKKIMGKTYSTILVNESLYQMQVIKNCNFRCSLIISNRCC